MHVGHNDPVAQHYALWQAAAFGLLVVHQEAQGAGMPHPCYMGSVQGLSFPCL